MYIHVASPSPRARNRFIFPCVQGRPRDEATVARSVYSVYQRSDASVDVMLVRPWRTMLKNCPIMLCSNALKCFNHYASKNCYYAHIMLTYNIIPEQVASLSKHSRLLREGVLHFKQPLQC